MDVGQVSPLQTVAPPAGRWRKRLVVGALGFAVLAGAGAYGTHWWTTLRFFEETDDAYLAADAVAVSPRIGGQVQEVLAADNQRVQAGQLLARLDDADYRVAQRVAAADVQSAEADVANVAAQIALLPTAIAQAEADVTSNEAQIGFAQSDARRYADLLRTGSGTQQRSQQADADIKQKQAALARARAALAAAHGQVTVLGANMQRAQAQAERARAALQQAGLNLGYTRITAPIAGAVGDRSLRLGQYVAPGTRVLDIVPMGQDIYAVANFKETQLAHMSAGEEVSMHTDMLPGVELRGHIDSLAPGSGAQFALLPPENATGNFTKVVQRVPVRISIGTAGLPPEVLIRLRPGLSVTASVDTRTQPAGPVRTLASE